MDVRTMEINHLTMGDGSAVNEGRVQYYISARHPLPKQSAIFPGVRRMKRLTRKFLGCEYVEDKALGRNGRTLFFILKSGTSAEDRAAFLAAVASYTKFRAY